MMITKWLFRDLFIEIAEIRRDLKELYHEVRRMSAALDTLTAQVAANTSVVDSAVVLIGGLAQQIQDLKNDPVALQALADSLKGEDDKLAAALVANTPSA
jgi:chromosome segregation ATPase